MGSYINSLFNLSLGESFNSVIEMTKTAKDNLFKIQENNDIGLKEFEQFLNYIYYGKGINKNNINNTYANQFSLGVENELVKIAQNYVQSIAGDGRINLAGSNLRSGSVGEIKVSEINERIKIVQDQINKVQDYAQYKQILVKLKALEGYLNQAKTFLESKWGATNLTKNKLLTKSMTSDGVNLLEQINLLWNEVSYVAGMPSNKEIGDVLEKSLPVVKNILDGQIDGSVSDMLQEAFSAKSVGETRTSAEELVSIIPQISINRQLVDNKDTSGNITSSTVQYVFGDNSDSVFSLSINALENFQQKMDVQLELDLSNAPNKDMRISAKSWGKMSGRDLGQTTLLNALLRTLNFDPTIALGLQLDYSSFASKNRSNASSWTDNLSKQAKYIAALDIVAGIGQKQGYADTLVIQDRGKKEFHVFNIRDILNDIQNNSGHFAIKGYNEGALTSNSLNYSEHITSQSWINALMTKMASQKISIGYRTKI